MSAAGSGFERATMANRLGAWPSSIAPRARSTPASISAASAVRSCFCLGPRRDFRTIACCGVRPQIIVAIRLPTLPPNAGAVPLRCAGGRRGSNRGIGPRDLLRRRDSSLSRSTSQSRRTRPGRSGRSGHQLSATAPVNTASPGLYVRLPRAQWSSSAARSSCG